MGFDQKIKDIYNANVYYQPTTTPVYCKNCATRLKTYYAEERLYIVKCAYCETLTFVQANNPTEAARYVGEFERSAP